MTADQVPRRADAQRNRLRIVEAARAAFAETGSEAQMDEIAERATVGVGTVYRHFPTKEALLEALLHDHLNALIDEFETAEAEEPTAWQALERVIFRFAHTQVQDRSLKQFMHGQVPPGQALEELQAALYGKLGDLVARAQRDGALRADVAAGDLPLLFGGLGQSDWLGGARGLEAVGRYVTVVLDGLRAPGTTPLPGRPLAPDEIEAMFRAAG